MTTTYRQQRQTQRPSSLWSSLVVLGVAVTVLGVLLIANPFSTAGGLAVLAGVALLVSGIAEIVSAVRAEHGGTAILYGVLTAAAGVVILLWPHVTLHAIAIVVGAVLIVAGVIRALLILAGRHSGAGHGAGRRRSLLVACLAVVLGILAVTWPAATVSVLAVLFGIQLVVTGVTEVLVGLALRP
ncbi:hypothetical protein CcI49_08700 [Frankia sp. CcI49]|uniref:HdeD family acid-resistance protein n=1 Tax=unclassified Frankia TaxID=2632575 RepID=UPI0006CA5D02|nr:MULTISPECIES: DUF308 domain-containing protein [unclassified Frankia]KPM54956.1 hypothetical protein ACG83_16435 [Frankia sp. R43]ONH61161.1 hypothetical protein CcI49_08700 [Frankia sp. CcI49]